jgi:hypothetical protein
MDFKRQTAVLSALVLVGMMFLVPAITGGALGKTTATVKATISGYPTLGLSADLVEKRLIEGKWVVEPRCVNIECTWTTEGSPLGGPEEGYVIYTFTSPPPIHTEVPLNAKVIFKWHNPRFGTNTCDVVPLSPITHIGKFQVNRCHITQGNFATAEYNLYYYP